MDSHQIDVRFLIKGTLSPTKDDLWAHTLYTNDAERQKMDRWVERGRGGSMWKLFTKNTKILSVTFSSEKSDLQVDIIHWRFTS